MDLIRETSDGVYIKIKVYPESKTESLSFDESSGLLKVRVNQPAVKGKANRRVLELLSDYFGDCEIVSGLKASRKTFLVRNVTGNEIKNKLISL